MTRPASGLDVLELLSRCHSCKNSKSIDFLRQNRGRLIDELLACDHLILTLDQPDLLRNARGRRAMVSGDHHHLNPSLLALADRLAYPRSQGVEHADESQEFQVRRKLWRIRWCDLRRCDSLCQGQHSKPSLGHRVGLLLIGFWTLGSILDCAHTQHSLGTSLHTNQRLIRCAVECGRETMLRLKRDLIDLRILTA